MFTLSNRSRSVLATVKPELRAVVEGAIKLSPVDFAVVQGGRTLDQQKSLYGKGRTAAQCLAKGVPSAYAQPHEPKVTWTLKSNHLVDPHDNLGRAVDLAPFVHGAINWDNDGKLNLWPQIALAMKAAACELGVEVKWGGDWQETPDRPHFELVR